ADDGLRRQARDRRLAGGGMAGHARGDDLPPARQPGIARRGAARDAGAAARRSRGGRVPGGTHPRRPFGRAVPCAHLPGRGRGRGAGAAGGAALWRGRQRPDRGRVRARGELRRQFPAPAWRAGAGGRGGVPGPHRPRRRRGAAAHRRHRARADRGGDGGMTPDGGQDEAGYAPPRWLRSPHLQTVLASSPWRRRRAAAVLARTGAVTSEHLLDGGDGVRLHGLHSAIPGTAARGLALLLHGWEGSAESSYMRLAAAQLLERGFEVFRLNFRDHGDTHHLNPDIFHSCRIDEVVHAARDVAARFGPRPLVLAGYSLGGNFALRVALRAPAAGLPLARVAAVCPVLDPAGTMARMEQGPW